MDFTISQIGSATVHPLRPTHVAGGGSRSSEAERIRPVDAVPSSASAGLRGAETEYDQFGRFTAQPAEATKADHQPGRQDPPANPSAKYFRAGKATAQELEREYLRSLIDSQVAKQQGGGVRRYIPAGMTEYQVNQLSGYQYRAVIEAERRALERAERTDTMIDAAEDTAVANAQEPANPLAR